MSEPFAGVRRIDPLADPDWDFRLAGCPGATFFHGAPWAAVLHGAYGYRPCYFAAGAAGRPGGLLPLMEVDSWLTGRRGVALPFTDECGPACADAAALAPLHAAALAHAAERKWKYLELRGGRALLGDAPASDSYWGHRLDLRAGEAALFDGAESSVRRAVRKAERSGLTVEFSQGREALEAFHVLLCQTRKRHGVPPQPFRFFAQIHRHILAPGLGWVALARQAGRPAAGAVFFIFRDTVIFKYGASAAAFQDLRPNNLVLWRAIARYAGAGFASLDFGRTAAAHEGLRRFKLGWGAQERRLDYVRYDCRSRRFVAAGRGVSPRCPRLLQLLPDPVFAWVGAALYKHVA